VALLVLCAGLFAGWDFVSSFMGSSASPDASVSQQERAPDRERSFVPDNASWEVPEQPQLSPLERGMIPTQRIPDRTSPTPTSPITTPAAPTSTVAASGESAVEQARRFGKGRQRTEAARGREALKYVEAWGEESRLWRENVEALLSNDAGRRIAATPELVDQFGAVMSEKRPPLDLATEMAVAVREMLEPLEKSLADPADVSAPHQGMAAEFQRYSEEAQSQSALLRKLRLRAEAIAAQAKGAAPVEITLSEAMVERERTLAATEAKNMQERLSDARREASEKVAAAEAKAIGMQADLDAADVQSKAERAKLIARAKSPDVQRYLATFLAKGYTQPVGNNMGIRYERTTQETPISFSRLQTSGALENSMQGLKTLNLIASEGWSPPNKWHDRPAWQIALDQPFTKSDQEFVQRAQDLLRELGPTLVDLKMLAP